MDVLTSGPSVESQQKVVVDELLIKTTTNTTAYSVGSVLKMLGEDDSWRIETATDAHIRVVLYKK